MVLYCAICFGGELVVQLYFDLSQDISADAGRLTSMCQRIRVLVLDSERLLRRGDF